jgi:hypothetical protein
LILDSTHPNKEHKQIVTGLVGKPYTFFETFKRKGVGSKRMIVAEVSPNMQKYINRIDDLSYANIEMRTGGILMYINKGLKNYTWVIPYYQLVLYKTNGASIHAQGKFVHFRNSKTFKENKPFFDKLLDEKVKYDEQFNFRDI